MKLEQFVRNIVNRLTTLGVNKAEIFSQEIIDELNNVIPFVRLQDIVKGNREYYGIKKELPIGLDSIDSPKLFESKLDPAPIPEMPTEQAIIRAFCYITPNKLKTIDTYEKGEYARIGQKLYTCIESFESKETKDLTFRSNKVRSTYSGSKHIDGDIAYDPIERSYYRTTDSIYEGSVPVEWTKLHWKEVGSSGIEPNYVSFPDLRGSQLMSYVFSVYQETLYTTPDIGEIVLWYIPEFEPIQKPDATIKLTTGAITQAREMVTQNLKQKLPISQSEQSDE